MADVKTIIRAIQLFLELAEIMEEILDPEDRTLVDDKIIAFLKELVSKL
jgi:hypothetical protein